MAWGGLAGLVIFLIDRLGGVGVRWLDELWNELTMSAAWSAFWGFVRALFKLIGYLLRGAFCGASFGLYGAIVVYGDNWDKVDAGPKTLVAFVTAGVCFGIWSFYASRKALFPTHLAMMECYLAGSLVGAPSMFLTANAIGQLNNPDLVAQRWLIGGGVSWIPFALSAYVFWRLVYRKLWWRTRTGGSLLGWLNLIGEVIWAVYQRSREKANGLAQLILGLMLVGAAWVARGHFAEPLSSLSSAPDSGITLGIAGFGTVMVAGSVLSTVYGWLKKKPPETHGRARLATVSEMREASMFPGVDSTVAKTGIYLGEYVQDQSSQNTAAEPAFYTRGVHLLTVGSTGVGKGTGLVIPNLANLERSCIVIDPKGEAAAVTARRRAEMGKVIVLNPCGLFAEELPHMRSHGFNPLATIDPDSDSFTSDCGMISEALVVGSGRESDPHWINSARDLVWAITMWEVISKRRPRKVPTLASVRKMASAYYSDDAKPSGLEGDYRKDFADIVRDMVDSGFEPIRAKVESFERGNRTTYGAYETLKTQTAILDNPMLQADLAKGDFDFASMKKELNRPGFAGGCLV